jgi:hypothetical protein
VTGSPQISDASPVWLQLATASAYARSLGLRRGDALIGISATPVQGDTRTILARLKRQPLKPVRLTFRRGVAQWDVICRAAYLGRWTAKPQTTQPAPMATEPGLRNWEIMVDADDTYDVQMQTPRWLALLAPVYLVQMRLWGPLAIWLALALLGAALGLVWGAAITLLVTVYVWRAGPVLVRADRQARGYRLWRVMASRNEQDLHRQLRQIAPQLRFAYNAA